MARCAETVGDGNKGGSENTYPADLAAAISQAWAAAKTATGRSACVIRQMTTSSDGLESKAAGTITGTLG
jgi:hypothetical protein